MLAENDLEPPPFWPLMLMLIIFIATAAMMVYVGRQRFADEQQATTSEGSGT